MCTKTMRGLKCFSIAAALSLSAAAPALGVTIFFSDPSGLSAEAEFTLLTPTTLQIRLRNTSTGVPMGFSNSDQLLTGISFDLGMMGVNVGDPEIVTGTVVIGPTSMSINFDINGPPPPMDFGPGTPVSGEYGFGNMDGTGLLPNLVTAEMAQATQFPGPNLDGPDNLDGPQAGLVADPIIVPLGGLGAIQDEVIITLTISQPLSDLSFLTLFGARVEFGSDAAFLDGFPGPAAIGACCLPMGGCVNVSQADCTAAGGVFLGDNTSCTPAIAGDMAICPAPGACCLPNGTCVQSLLLGGADCIAAGGTYQGDNTVCNGVTCQPMQRPDATEKGSVLFFSKIEIRWNAAGHLVQDTFVQLTNDNNAGVHVQMYFINGDPPLAAVAALAAGERAHPGWNNIDNMIYLTANQPIFWSALTGQPGSSGGGISPFTVLDPGTPPGRPDPEGSSDRVLRGYIIAFAVNAEGEEIKWNHLAGNATVVNYRDSSAWEYNAWSFQAVNPNLPNGALTGTPGMLNFDGIEFAQGFDLLLINFQAEGSTAFSGPGNLIQAISDLTLHPVSADLRQETNGPKTTKVKFDIWNQNEVKFSGAERCITCWEQRLLGNWSPSANHFLRVNLQTNVGKARIDGVASQLCNVLNPNFNPNLPIGPSNQPYLVLSSAESLLGVLSTRLIFNGGMRYAETGVNPFGMGFQSAVIEFDLMDSPPTMQDPDQNAQGFVEDMRDVAAPDLMQRR